MASRLERLVSAHANRASVDRRLTTYALPEGGFVHAYAHRAGHHHLVSEPTPALSLRVPSALVPEGVALLRRLGTELSGRALAPLHSAVLSTPILGASCLGGVLFVADPELGASVLLAVGITAVEARFAALQSSEPVASALRARDAWLVTLAERDPVSLSLPTGAPESEGHDVPTLELHATSHVLVLEPARAWPTIAAHLVARLTHGRSFRLRGPTLTVAFERAARDLVEVDEGRSFCRVGLSDAALDRVELDAGSAPTAIGPLGLELRDDPAPALRSTPPSSVSETEPLRPSEARRMAEEAAHESALEEALSLIPLAVEDGSHGLLAELLHIDLLRRLGRTDAARAQLWRTADAWLGGERAQVWNTQWKRLLELSRKLKLDLGDPRLVRARALAR